MSSFGNAPSRQKSIDVEFNLLRTWSAARLDLRRRLVRTAALGGAILVGGGALLPVLASARSEAAADARRAELATANAQKRAVEREEAAKLVLPAVQREAEILASARRVDALLSSLALVLNASPDALVVRSLDFDVAESKFGVKLRAVAPDAETARTFAQRVGAAPGIEGAKASSIGPDPAGVAFDFSSKGAMTP